jgi:DNA-binding winged helix-turn-helix (wHTH) protein
VPSSGAIFRFGPFELDSERRRLVRDAEPMALGSRTIELLCALVARAPAILSKDELIQAAWGDVAVTDNSLEQAISALRRTLGKRSDGPYIETQARRGYRFVAPVQRLERRASDEVLEALLAPHRAWIEGRAALETLERSHILHAREVFDRVLAADPAQAPAHVGLANACVMQFEMTRADAAPDRASLELAAEHAREACRLDSEYGEAWATLGFVLERTGQHDDARAALRRAIALEPDNWRHQVRLSYSSWGDERLSAARRALSLLPGLAMSHWLAATVHVARGALTEAEREVGAGIAALQAPPQAQERFSAVALYWLSGLLHLRAGKDEAALDAFERELAGESSGHLYARECCGNTWYAIGALHLRRGRLDDARAALVNALDRLPAHPFARIGLAAIDLRRKGSGTTHTVTEGVDPLRTRVTADGASGVQAPNPVDAAMCQAAALVLAGQPDIAAAGVEQALDRVAPGQAGWLLPIEPLIHVGAAPEVWSGALARLRARAM